MLERLRQNRRDARLRRDLLRQSRDWKDLGTFRQAAFEAWRSGASNPWKSYGARRRELIEQIASIVFSNASLREVASDLGMSRLDVAEAYRKLIRHSSRPWAVQPYHLPTALMLLPAWLEAVGALYLAGELDKGVADLENALITMDGTYPLSVIEPLVFSGRLAHAQTV